MKQIKYKKTDYSNLKEIILDKDYSSSEGEISINELIKELDYEENGRLGQDEPLEIINVGKINKFDKELYCEIKWKKGENGLQKKNSIVKTNKRIISKITC